LEHALEVGLEVRIWYVGLDTVERHIARVAARVAGGGHDIPEQRIRQRFASSHVNSSAAWCSTPCRAIRCRRGVRRSWSRSRCRDP